jgi:hypothetical protein
VLLRPARQFSGPGLHRMDTLIEQDRNQVLFQSRGRDGSAIALTIRPDGRCAIMRNGEVVHSCPYHDEPALESAVRLYMSMIERGQPRQN